MLGRTGNPKVMRHGFRYFVPRKERTWDDLGRFFYAEPASYADYTGLGDCWIVDSEGQVHPGHTAAPMPMRVSQLKMGVRIT